MKNEKSTSLGGDVVRLTTSKVITLCITMVTTMMLSRFRTLNEYGTYSQILLVVNLFSSVFMLGLPNSINFYLSRCETTEEKQKFLSVYYSLSTALSILMGGALILSVPIIVSYFDNPAIKSFVFFLAVYPWTQVINSSIGNVLVVYKKTRYLLVYNCISSICILATVLIIQFLGLGFYEYMVAYLLVVSTLAVSVYIIARKCAGRLIINFSPELIKKIFAFSIPIGLAGIVGTLDIEIDKLMIGKLMDTEQLAIYTNASKELPMTMVATSITAVLLPTLSKLMKEKQSHKAIQLWKTATELSFLVMSLIVAGLVTYAKEVMEILYSEKYLSGISVFQVYSLVLLLRVTYFGIILNSAGKTKEILYCSIIALVLNAVLNPLLFIWLGMIGPAIATFLSIFIVQLIQLWMSAKITGEHFSNVYPWIPSTLILLLNGALAVFFFFIKKWLPLEQVVGNIVESILLGVIWTAIYAIIVRKKALYLWHRLNEG